MDNSKKHVDQFAKTIEKKQQRKIQARDRKNSTVFWIGMFGLVGWSVAIPTIIGISLGIWLDKTYPGKHSWTLMLLVAGVAVGCWQAWYWIKEESKDIDSCG
ncbi:AtpZ/AtpI family protein [Candidatus Uabimicrobium amorphum]|uniref:ATP synthase I n=1 Tax=Uabimicrobium amorphum TaxID=2596890 RepID=A0A5S9F564_UABAM|nr:AtpZ/AtpI family protein [Candidatus Uabimicrobium amorphum]BBM85833.1 ATP synthase I [Candidatus Uabimicrobium amorphum]